jgi:hypothetical protein
MGTIGAGIAYVAGGFEPTKRFIERHFRGWPEEGVEIVLDTSGAMSAAFAGGLQETKMDVAVGVLGDNGTLSLDSNTSLAFRQFGGEACNDGVTRLLLGFAKDTASRMRSLLPSIHPNGNHSSLLLALSRAIDDFNGDRFAGKKKRIIVIWGGSVDCWSDSAHSMENVGNMLLTKHFVPDLHFIGMGLPPQQKEQLKEIAKKTEGKFIAVENRPELAAALLSYLVIEPISEINDSAIKLLKVYIDDMTSFYNEMNNKEYSIASARLENANADLGILDKAIGELKSQSQPQLRTLYVLFLKIREIQTSLKANTLLLLESAQSNNEEMFAERLREYTEYAKQFNGTLEEIRDTAREIKKLGPLSESSS